MKLTPELVAKTAASVNIEAEAVQRLLERLADMVVEAETEEKPPKIKKQWVVVASRPSIETEGAAPVGWVLQIPDEASPAQVVSKVHEAAHSFNVSKKGRTCPVQTIGEAFESASAKHFKAAGVWVKTKEPVYLILADIEIPETPSVLGGDK
jgi:hypothetical protein